MKNTENQKKIIVFKYKPKKNYKRKYGHRQTYTRIKITDIIIDKTKIIPKKVSKIIEKKNDTKTKPIINDTNISKKIVTKKVSTSSNNKKSTTINVNKKSEVVKNKNKITKSKTSVKKQSLDNKKKYIY